MECEFMCEKYPERPLILDMGKLRVVIHPGNAIRIFGTKVEDGVVKTGRIKMVLRHRDFKYAMNSHRGLHHIIAELSRWYQADLAQYEGGRR